MKFSGARESAIFAFGRSSKADRRVGKLYPEVKEGFTYALTRDCSCEEARGGLTKNRTSCKTDVGSI